MTSTPASSSFRLQRTSIPAPAEREIHKKLKVDMDTQNIHMAEQFHVADIQSSQQFAISPKDIKKIADAVKATMLNGIVQLIEQQTAPLLTKIQKLEKENSQLKIELDALE